MGKFNVVTISRTFGSGGKGIGKQLADEMGYAFYDKEVVRLASERSGLPEEFFNEDRTGRSSLLYSLAMGLGGAGALPSQYQHALSDDRVFSLQSDIIREKAAEGRAVFVGRCAGYVLRHEANVLNVYLNADIDYRVAQIAARYQISEDAARKKIQKTDKSRKTYYTYYTNHTWGDTTDYHMCLNISKLGQQGAARMIRDFLELANES